MTTEDEIIRELTTPEGEKRMRPDQEAGISRILAGMGFPSDGSEVADLLYRVDAKPDAWRNRTLTQAQANSVLEMLGRFYESRTRPEGSPS